MPKRKKSAVTALLLVTLIWGAALPIVKPVFETLTVAQFLFARYLIASALSLLVLPFYHFPHLSINKWINIILLEFFGVPVLLSILYAGVARTSALESSLIGAMSPLFTILGGVWFLHERETKREWLGFATALAGTIIMVLEPLLAGSQSFSGSILGNLLILLYNLLWAVYLIAAKRHYRQVPKTLTSIAGNFVGFAVFGLFCLLTGTLPTVQTFMGPAFFPIFYMGTLGSLVAVSLYLYGQSKIEASEASIYTYLQPLVAIPVSYLVLDEIPSILTLAALSVIAAGVYYAEFRKS